MKLYFHGFCQGYGKTKNHFRGKKDSGIWCRLSSPNTGIEVRITHDKERRVDIIEVYETLGGIKNGLKTLIFAGEREAKIA